MGKQSFGDSFARSFVQTFSENYDLQQQMNIKQNAAERYAKKRADRWNAIAQQEIDKGTSVDAGLKMDEFGNGLRQVETKQEAALERMKLQEVSIRLEDAKNELALQPAKSAKMLFDLGKEITEYQQKSKLFEAQFNKLNAETYKTLQTAIPLAKNDSTKVLSSYVGQIMGQKYPKGETITLDEKPLAKAYLYSSLKPIYKEQTLNIIDKAYALAGLSDYPGEKTQSTSSPSGWF